MPYAIPNIGGNDEGKHHNAPENNTFKTKATFPRGLGLRSQTSGRQLGRYASMFIELIENKHKHTTAFRNNLTTLIRCFGLSMKYRTLTLYIFWLQELSDAFVPQSNSEIALRPSLPSQREWFSRLRAIFTSLECLVLTIQNRWAPKTCRKLLNKSRLPLPLWYLN